EASGFHRGCTDGVQKVAGRMMRRLRAHDVYSYIGYERMFEDGTCEVEEGLWSQTVSFSDISYQAAGRDEQEVLFERYCGIFNCCAADGGLQVSMVNTPIPEREIGCRKFFPEVFELGEYVSEYNGILNEKMLEGRNNLIRTRYVTVSAMAGDYEEALDKLEGARGSVAAALGEMGCSVKMLDGAARVKLLASQLRPGREVPFSYGEMRDAGLTTKDYVCPGMLDFAPEGLCDCFRTEGIWGQVLLIRNMKARISDTALSGIIDLPYPMNITIHVRAMPQGADVEYVKERLGWIDKEIADRQMKAARNGNDPNLMPQNVIYSKDEAEELLDQLLHKNQRLFRFTGAIYTWANSREALERQVEEIIRAARRESLVVETGWCVQKEGLNTVLPLGINHLYTYRYLTTAQLSLLIPFATFDLFDEGGGYYGQNSESKNLILFNRKAMSNRAGWVLGKPGEGKSFFVKREITNTRLLHPADEIYIIDPNNEYAPLAASLGGEVFTLSNSGGDRINPFEFFGDAEEASEEDGVGFKSEAICAICSSVLEDGGKGLTAEERSVIDRCVRQTYEEFEDSPIAPTLEDFHRILCMQKDAGRLPAALEIYVMGSAAAFNSPTTVDIRCGMTCFSFKALGKNMRTFAMLVILNFVHDRMLDNFRKGIATWLYVDEAQALFDDADVVAFFSRFWSEGRKFNLIPTAITQIAEKAYRFDEARYMLSNSDFIVMFKQSPTDLKLMSGLLSLSEAQAKYIGQGARPGCGLMCIGGAKVPFEDEFPKGKLYELWNTKPDEIAEKNRASWRARKGEGTEPAAGDSGVSEAGGGNVDC
ncbi:MAG: conjugal transfer protein TraC, partial [Eggerthellaceae bacterium]|nr:conjugal transfer protein TraC [Eggerthellaceae bacterium]